MTEISDGGQDQASSESHDATPAEAVPQPTEPAGATSPDAVPDPKAEAAKKWRRDPAVAMAFRKGLPVDGTIEQVIKGGYEVRVGKARGFCPHSQMDVHHVDRPETFLGKTLPFLVIQMRRGGEEAILSRRALLEASVAEEQKAVRATLLEGHVMQGHVARLTDFGAFVDLGAGVTGLVHVSEIAHGRTLRPSDVLTQGQTVQVKILHLDEANGRISLSIRQAADDPWKAVAERYPSGVEITGVVRRLADFGAFVEVAPGLEALAPADGFPPGPNGWRDAVTEGHAGTWRVVAVDAARRRMSIQPAGDGATPRVALAAGARVKGRVQRAERFGVFVWLGPASVGLLPGAYSGTRKGTDLSRAFPVGQEIEVEVVDLGADGDRIRLAVPGAAPKPDEPPQASRPPLERREPRGEAKRAPEAPPATFGTSLADALREAMKKGPGPA